MEGPEGAAGRITGWLERRLPQQLTAVRSRLNVPPDVLPDPGLVLPYDRLRLGLEAWPAVLVEVQQLSRLRRTDVLDGVELYAATYPARVYVWVRGDDEASTDLVRKRYALAVRETLLARRQLAPAAPYGDPPPPDAGTIAVDPLSIRESYSPPMTDDAGATIQGAYLTVDVTVREELRTDLPAGTASTATLDTAPLPHPATL